MFHKQHCHVLSPLPKISRTNEAAFKAVVTALHLMKAFFIDCCHIAVGEAGNDHYSTFAAAAPVTKSAFAIKVLLWFFYSSFSPLREFSFPEEG